MDTSERLTIPDLDAIQEIAAYRGSPCVSLYAPLRRKEWGTAEDSIRLKNLMEEAAGRLATAGMRKPEIDKLLHPAKSWLAGLDLSTRREEGIAFFLSPVHARIFELPLAVQEQAHAGDRFVVKPLLRCLPLPRSFAVLALSKHGPRLVRYADSRVETVALPEELSAPGAKDFAFEGAREQVQFHTRTTPRNPGGGRRDHQVHGHGAGKETEKERVQGYFRDVDHAVNAALKDSGLTLVLASVAYLIPLYREIQGYPLLAEASVRGNPERWSANRLVQEALQTLLLRGRRDREEAAERYFELVNTGKVSTRLNEVLPSAVEGRVESIFVAGNRARWGSFDRSRNEVLEHEAPRSGDEDLLDLAASATLVNGGQVFVLDKEQLPDQEDVAAIFRYVV